MSHIVTMKNNTIHSNKVENSLKNYGLDLIRFRNDDLKKKDKKKTIT